MNTQPPSSDSIFPETLYGKLYTENAILLGTFLGGPLAGGYLLAQNFKAIEQPGKVATTWVITGVVLVLLIASELIPALENIPTLVYSFVYCLAAHTAAKRFQGAAINLHRAHGGPFYGTGRAALVGVVSVVMMVAVLLSVFYLATASH